MEASDLIAGIKRRRVVRALIAYAILVFAVLQIIEPIMHGLRWPEAVLSYVVVALAVGFPFVLGIAWAFDAKAIQEAGSPPGTSSDSVLQALGAAPALLPPSGVPWLGDRYLIDKEIGRGGMGRVFRARDTRLGRDVAVKVLVVGAHGEGALRRFEQEARATGSLEHPNILAVYDVGSEGGIPFIVSELLRGATLRERLARQPFEVKLALDLAAQLAEGLSAAHEKSVIHRDLKPENLFLTDDGRLKILDFGIAKLLAASDGGPTSPPPPTETGVVLGTVGYMSPEQVRGEPVDARSDLFSFGCVLYEMLASRRTFARDTKTATNFAILNDEPAPLPEGIPNEVGSLVRRCLEKAPERRYQSARELAQELAQLRGISTTAPLPLRAGRLRLRGWWAAAAALPVAVVVGLFIQRRAPSAPPAAPARVTVAAADFVNETKEEELNGLSGMLITSLEQSKRLSVLTRGRMFDTLKMLGRGDAERIDERLGREISKHANVDALVLATIRRFGQLYAIDLKILDPVKNEYVFTADERCSGKESIPAMIDRLAERTRAALKERAEEIRAASVPVAKSTTASVDAYHHYFQGEQLVTRIITTTGEGAGEYEQALTEFREAARIDPRFGLAHFGMALAQSWVFDPAAVQSLELALQLGLPDSERCVAEGLLTFQRGQLERAIELVDACAARFPQQKLILFQAGDMRFHRGLMPGAAASFTQALAIDPTFRSAAEHALYAWQALDRPDKALEVATAFSAHVLNEDAFSFLAFAQQLAGQRSLAIETLRAGCSHFPLSVALRQDLAWAQLFEGDAEAAEAALHPVMEGTIAPKDKVGQVRARVQLDVFRGRYRAALEGLAGGAARAKVADDPRLASRFMVFQAWLLASGLRDLSAARRTLTEVNSMKAGPGSNPNTFFAWTAVGDADRVETAEGAVGRADLDLHLAALRARDRGPSAEAVAAYERLAGLPYWSHWMLYELANRYLETDQPQKAIAALVKLQRAPPLAVWTFLLWHPRSFYLLGKAHERAGESTPALAAYDRFLTLWKDADPDLAELRDAKARVAALRPPR